MNIEPKPADGGKILEVHATGDFDKHTREHAASLTAQLFSACLVAVYDSVEHAERALHILHRNRFPKDQISVVMSRLRKEPALLSEIQIGEESVRDAALSAGLGGVLGYFSGIVLALVTGAGTFFLIGPIAGLFGCATLGGWLGAIAGLGVRHEHICRYEQHVKDGKVLVIAHGDPITVDEARRKLKETGVGQIYVHAR